MNKVILAVGAHPDDLEFGASGTVVKFVRQGAIAYYVICTDGSRGSNDPLMTHESLSLIRKKEQEKACSLLGVKKVFFLNHKDTELISDRKLKEELVRIIRTVKPDIVISMDPTFYYSVKSGFINHTDHRAAALAAMDACFPLSRDRLTFLEHEKRGLKPHKVKELWLVSFEKTDFLVDITETIEIKLKALSLHKSQFGDFSKIEKRVKDRAKMLGKSKGFNFAENFVRIKLP